MMLLMLVSFLLAFLPLTAAAVDWVRPAGPGAEPRWGIKGRLQISIPPSWGGPRGLIRVLYPTLKGGGYDLINFIAIEPVVAGARGFSEMEHSALDNEQGKRLWSDARQGSIRKLGRGVEELSVDLHVERFDNGAHVWLTAAIRSDVPDEIQLTTHAVPDSKPLEFCVLTATMGNKARARILWLDDGPQRATNLWPGIGGTGFAASLEFASSRMSKAKGGNLLAAIATDEPEPAKAPMPSGAEGWAYLGFPVTQYWKKPKGVFEVVVNARAAYWGDHRPIPGGPAIENFELREPFRDGAQFVFGVTPRSPRELGFSGG